MTVVYVDNQTTEGLGVARTWSIIITNSCINWGPCHALIEAILHALLKYLLMVLDVFLVLGPFNILKDFYLCSQNLWPFLFYDLGCFVWSERVITTTWQIRAACLHSLYNREELYHYLLFPPCFLPGFQGARALAFWVFSTDSTLIGWMERKYKN